MTSVYYPTLKDAIGEMLFVLCGSDGEFFSFGFELVCGSSMSLFWLGLLGSKILWLGDIAMGLG
jgi:hypothetical protein